MRTSTRRLQALLLAVIGVALTTAGVIAYATDALGDVELDSVDARFSIRGEREPPSDLVLVEIDDVTFDELGLRWPFPRSTHARAIDRIAAERPRAIAYDVQFSERGPRRGDIRLAESIAAARGLVVLATTEVNERGEGRFLGAPEDVLRDLGGRLANGLLPNDPGGVIRRVSYAVDGLESFAVATVETAGRRRVERDDFSDEGGWIDYYGAPDTINSVSLSRVVRGQTAAGLFKDKIVVVGPTAPSLQDLHPTSTTGDDQMSGAEIQANAIATVRRQLPLERAPAAVELASIVLLGLAAPVASLRLSPLRALALTLLLGALFTIIVQLAFNAGTIVSFVYPLATLALVSVGVLALHYLTTAFERERVRGLFSRFVPEDVVDDVIARADEDLRLGGVQREGTVMFSDLRGFTRFAESLPVERVIEVLNRYLGEMSDAIMDHGGTLVAYMGDGIMAVFGAPIEQHDHADRALAAAREMLFERLPAFNAWLRSRGLGDGFRIGIGLNSGAVMSGHVGSERRIEYTAIGDVTNTASRIESMTKDTQHQLLLADSTRSLLQRGSDGLAYVDELQVRGRSRKVKLWALADDEPDGVPPVG